METFYYNKGGRVASFITRDILIMDMGDKLPTITEYCQRFNVSRGIVQNALSFLEEKKAIVIEASGAKGTWLKSIDPAKLILYSGWDLVSMLSPLPFDEAFSSLATAIKYSLNNLPLPTSFAYISGSSNRIRFLEKQTFDFAVFSQSTANTFSKLSHSFDSPIILENSIYSYPFALFSKHDTSEIQDGMRMINDPSSHDHNRITQLAIQGKRVHSMELPYVAFSEMLSKDLGDFVIVRKEKWTKGLKELGFHEYPVEEFSGYSTQETTTPVILTNKKNYGMRNLLNHYINKEALSNIQKEVLNGTRPAKLY